MVWFSKTVLVFRIFRMIENGCKILFGGYFKRMVFWKLEDLKIGFWKQLKRFSKFSWKYRRKVEPNKWKPFILLFTERTNSYQAFANIPKAAVHEDDRELAGAELTDDDGLDKRAPHASVDDEPRGYRNWRHWMFWNNDRWHRMV